MDNSTLLASKPGAAERKSGRKLGRVKKAATSRKRTQTPPDDDTLPYVPRDHRARGRNGRIARPKGPFAAHMRMPEWHTDAIIDATGENWVELFPEEAVGRDENGVVTPFILNIFDPNASPKHTWLGGELKKGSNLNKFDRYLTELAQTSRVYNFLLYFLRFWHFLHDHRIPPKQLPAIKAQLTDLNAKLHGLRELLKERGLNLPFRHLTEKPDQISCRQLECCWQKAAETLNSLLEDGSHQLGHVYADLIQVNGFIVSMRVVAACVKPICVKEPVGSSSHISLSYPFWPLGA